MRPRAAVERASAADPNCVGRCAVLEDESVSASRSRTSVSAGFESVANALAPDDLDRSVESPGPGSPRTSCRRCRRLREWSCTLMVRRSGPRGRGRARGTPRRGFPESAGVSVNGTRIETSEHAASSPPSRPVNASVPRPRARATCAAWTTFFEVPDVLIRPQDIARAAVAEHLLREHHVRCDIIRERRRQAGLAHQRDRSQGALEVIGEVSARSRVLPSSSWSRTAAETGPSAERTLSSTRRRCARCPPRCRRCRRPRPGRHERRSLRACRTRPRCYYSRRLALDVGREACQTRSRKTVQWSEYRIHELHSIIETSFQMTTIRRALSLVRRCVRPSSRRATTWSARPTLRAGCTDRQGTDWVHSGWTQPPVHRPRGRPVGAVSGVRQRRPSLSRRWRDVARHDGLARLRSPRRRPRPVRRRSGGCRERLRPVALAR